MDRDAIKAARLTKTYNAIIKGDINITPHYGPQFLAAFCAQPNPSDCLQSLVASKVGLLSLQTAIRYDLSVTFLNSHGSAVLQYLQHDDLKVINNGLFLADIVTKIAYPPTFWIEFRKAFLQGELDDAAMLSFGWLLLQLCLLPSDNDSAPYRNDADMEKLLQKLRSLTSPKGPAYAAKIADILSTVQSTANYDTHAFIDGPGGRHDNDFEDFRKIAIIPTSDELLCTKQPFLRPASVLDDPSTEPARAAIHLDNQFRLLREDMLSEMREEIQVATNEKKGRRRGFKLQGLKVLDIHFGKDRKGADWGLVCECSQDFPQMAKLKGEDQRMNFLADRNNRNFFKHKSLACLLVKNEPPHIVLQFDSSESTKRALHKLSTEKDDVVLIQIDTAVFAYEPTLKALQASRTLPLSNDLLLWNEGDILDETEDQPRSLVEALRANPQMNLKDHLNIPDKINLDRSQAQSLISGLTQKVSLIQGPPGTGKSFIGALLAKSLHDKTKQRILVVCYTNHALDDILTSFLDIGIPPDSIVRLGGKSTARTECLKMPRGMGGSQRSQKEWDIIHDLETQLNKLNRGTASAFGRYMRSSVKVNFMEILDYLELEDPGFFQAFSVPTEEDGMTLTGRGGKAVQEDYLIERWSRGLDAGSLKFAVSKFRSLDGSLVWDLHVDKRMEYMERWKGILQQEAIDAFCSDAQEYNRCQHRLDRAFKKGDGDFVRTKRILGCTTTAAAMYRTEIVNFKPNVLLVEEAGEILESHVLTSMGPDTSQMILIGDHKQLRPKVNNYMLTVEKGAGYDLNRSLFERLIMKGYPHQTLSQQHRMRPEISSLIRHLTYPELTDAARTQGRPDLMGVQDNIVFIHHENLEDANSDVADKNDMGSSTSKQNSFEIFMILKIVKYLAQQGYQTKDLVVLTPYLGQLKKLRDVLKSETDPILNDLDSAELIRAGVMAPAHGGIKKNPLHISTIDNYQGEESDIVIVSLTRSNKNGDIGFMYSPERLNVLLSRARNALIMIGNANTFQNSRKGKDLWQSLFGLLADGQHIYQGFPAVCQRHPDTKVILENANSFDNFCPDGGCTLPCGEKLGCGHECPSRCHVLNDHSKLKCMEMQSSKCDNQHRQTWPCSSGPPKMCHKCDRLAKLAKVKQQQDLEEAARRDAEQQAHLAKMDALNAEIEKVRKRKEAAQLAVERDNAIRQKQEDLESLKTLAIINATQTPPSPSTSGLQHAVHPSNRPPSSTPSSTPTTQSSNAQAPADTQAKSSSLLGKMWESVASAIQPVLQTASAPPPPPKSQSTSKPFKPLTPSPYKQQWEHLKNMQGATSTGIDCIMEMTGLEAIKKQVLEIRSKIEISLRQGVSMKKERLNCVFLGNPGTGKTTVARHYALFLAEVKAIPGNTFIETTGARLAQEGVDEAKKMIQSVLSGGGGTIFVDEAYQLTNGNSHGGPAVLDFLLAEMENNVGSLVFILAGYNKEMEKFFEHNPGLKSRVPYQFRFEDYTDEELMAMFKAMVVSYYSGRMMLEDGYEGLYSRIVIRRLGRRRGQPGFGNARDLELAFASIRGRHATRITKANQAGIRADIYFMEREDLIGHDPRTAVLESSAWKKLQALIGLKSVKESVQGLFNLIGENYQRELQEKEIMDISLNRVFLGSPGTGKTTVAKLYGQIMADLGLLTNGEVVVKNPADFTGAVLGASEAQTKAILANSVGKVLIIDEAYMLYGGGGKDASGGGGSSNQFKTSVIDTIVAEVQNVPGEDRCVLMLGYKDQMTEMFQNVNPGLARRFKIEDAFNFEDLSDAELLQILNNKLAEGDLDATDSAKAVALEYLIRVRNRPNFGNAGEVENIITAAKQRCVARRAKMDASQRPADIIFEPQDFDPDFNRGETAGVNLVKLFDDIVGCEGIIKRLKGYQDLALVCKKTDRDPRDLIPTNFIFTGPPGKTVTEEDAIKDDITDLDYIGTGKTTVARKMGQVYYDMGMLGSSDVVECSASDLVGQYVGQTGPKTKKLFEKALGKVLFVDEAYRLSEGQFAQEAIDELVGLLTHPSFKAKLIVILAGYENDINRLLSVNAGLSSRFPEQVPFHNMAADHCMKILSKELEKKKVALDELNDPTSSHYLEMREVIIDMSELKDWGNARDVITLSQALVSRALLSLTDASAGTDPRLPPEEALQVMQTMLQERQKRSKVPAKPRKARMPEQSDTFTPQPPPNIATSSSTATAPPPATVIAAAQPQSPVRAGTPVGGQRGRGRARGSNQPRGAPRTPTSPPAPSTAANGGVPRDPGVTDAEWQELNEAKRAAIAIAERAKEEESKLQRKVTTQKRIEAEQRAKRLALERALAAEQEAARKAELQRQRDEAQRKERAAQAARQKALDDLRAKQAAERMRQQQEERAQQKLRQMGVCSAGFQWINCGSYYRCAGGSHRVDASRLQ